MILVLLFPKISSMFAQMLAKLSVRVRWRCAPFAPTVNKAAIDRKVPPCSAAAPAATSAPHFRVIKHSKRKVVLSTLQAVPGWWALKALNCLQNVPWRMWNALFSFLTISLFLPPDCIRIDCNLSKCLLSLYPLPMTKTMCTPVCWCALVSLSHSRGRVCLLSPPLAVDGGSTVKDNWMPPHTTASITNVLIITVS